MDPSLVFDNINLGRRIDVQWPNEEWKQNGGRNGWHGWIPMKGMEGAVVHKWTPCHRETIKRSHVDKVILLVQIGEKFVPVAEQGVLDLGAEVWYRISQKFLPIQGGTKDCTGGGARNIGSWDGDTILGGSGVANTQYLSNQLTMWNLAQRGSRNFMV